jgi:hypothetical protein
MHKYFRPHTRAATKHPCRHKTGVGQVRGVAVEKAMLTSRCVQGTGGGDEPRYPVVGPQMDDVDDLGEGPGWSAGISSPRYYPGRKVPRTIRPGHGRRAFTPALSGSRGRADNG